jgi:hypothetical protein
MRLVPRVEERPEQMEDHLDRRLAEAAQVEAAQEVCVTA